MDFEINVGELWKVKNKKEGTAYNVYILSVNETYVDFRTFEEDNAKTLRQDTYTFISKNKKVK